MRILSLQPYFAGSHRQFHEGWVRRSRHNWTTLKLPGRHWKWRMRHAAIYFAEQVEERFREGERWDAILCTDMMNVAEFRGLAFSVQDVPTVLYFHENQFAYPNRYDRERDQHFPFTNFVSALAADRVWFNSAFNRDSMLSGLRERACQWPDFVPQDEIDLIANKSTIQHPGLDVPSLDWLAFEHARRDRIHNGSPLHLIWAARWEHDKNPAALLTTLQELAQTGVPFKLSVIGEQFRNSPKEFDLIRSEFSDVIVRWGFQRDRESYWQALCEADVFLSTANHEFFGLAAAEAIAAGVFPLLPNRLAYPELLEIAGTDDRAKLYGESFLDLAKSITQLHRNRKQFAQNQQCQEFRHRLCWTERAKILDEAACAVT